MARQGDQDRFLMLRSGIYYYWRHVPKNVAHLDDRIPAVRLSLKTDDLAKARAQRDILEAADNTLWASFLTDGKTESSMAAHKVARARAEALGFTYKPAVDVAALPLEALVARLSAITDARTPVVAATAVMGGVDRPKVKVTEAFKIYCDEIAAVEIVGKSDEQKASWKKVKRYAVDVFVEVVGDICMDEITRDHAKKMHNHFKKLIAPTEPKAAKKSASLGKRRMGDMSILYKRYFAHIGVDGRPNPFEGLTFNQKFKKRRVPFPIEYVRDTIMKPGALAGMNDEARHIVLVSIETGARPIELRYLRKDRIKLHDKVPHILVEPSFDPDEPHEVKTVSSVRRIPLVGAALAAMKLHPDGFPRYRETGNTLSQTVNKFLKENKLQPTGKETLYSFRHTFEDRLKEGRIDDELRKILMGHAIDREMYGSGGSLKLYREELMKIVYPFDKAII